MKQSMVVFVGLLLILPTAVFAEVDSQIWHIDTVEKLLKGPWYLRLEEELRLGDDFGKLIYQATDIGLVNRSKEWLPLSVHYAYIRCRHAKDWETEHRPHADITIKWDWLDFHFSDRNRLEYQMRSNTKDNIRYRNKLKIETPWQWTRWQVNPYIADEYFVDFDQFQFNTHRYEGGLKFDITERLDGTLFYLRQSSDGRFSQRRADVIGTRLEIKF